MTDSGQTRESDVNEGTDLPWPWAEQNDFGFDTMDLYTAASLGKEDCVKKCLESLQDSADVDKQNRGGWTPLMYSAYWGHETVLKLLLMSKSNPREKNFSGHTALMLAAMCDNVNCGKTLLQHGASTEDRDNQDWTALFHAVYLGHLNFFHLLIENGAQLNICEKIGKFTPLMIGANAGHELIVAALLQNGANPLEKSVDGDTAKSLAEKKGYVKVVSVLESHHLQKFNQETSIQYMPELFSHLMDAYGISVTKQPKIPGIPGLPPWLQENSLPMPYPTDLKAFLNNIGLSKYYPVLESQDIDLEAFLTLDESGLEKAGIKLIGPKRKMSAAISRWHRNAPLLSTPEEQVYANYMSNQVEKLEQELEKVKSELDQERTLRSTVESFVIMERNSSQNFVNRIHTVLLNSNSIVEHIRNHITGLQHILYQSPTQHNFRIPATYSLWQGPSDPQPPPRLSPALEMVQKLANFAAELHSQLSDLLLNVIECKGALTKGVQRSCKATTTN
ncbi:uncharacterized protein LOC143225443 isoform X3 [Tachypleus tridentatus]